MDQDIRIALVGDPSSPRLAPRAIEDAIQHVARWRDRAVVAEWTDPEHLAQTARRPGGFDAVWITPEAESAQHALARVFRVARDLELPLLATGSAAFWIVTNVVRAWAERPTPIAMAAIPAEPRPSAALSHPGPSPMTSAPPGAAAAGSTPAEGLILLEPGSTAAGAYGCWRVVERYGADRSPERDERALMALSERQALRVAGRDERGRPAVIELPGHPFFVATRFLPQLGSAPYTPAPLPRALVDIAILSRTRRNSRPTPRWTSAMLRPSAFGMAP